MEQQTGSKLGKEYVKAIYCHSAYLTYMQSTSYELPGWKSTSWNQDCRRNINNHIHADDITFMAKSDEVLKSLLMRVKEESEKAGLNSTLKNNDLGIGSHHFMANRWVKSGNSG